MPSDRFGRIASGSSLTVNLTVGSESRHPALLSLTELRRDDDVPREDSRQFMASTHQSYQFTVSEDPEVSGMLIRVVLNPEQSAELSIDGLSRYRSSRNRSLPIGSNRQYTAYVRVGS